MVPEEVKLCSKTTSCTNGTLWPCGRMLALGMADLGSTPGSGHTKVLKNGTDCFPAEHSA